MTPKAHILVVEDKALIYKRLKIALNDQHYAVDDYTPSVEDAIGRINNNRPDLVLLDIDLQGDYNGIYLGQLLKNEYHIPFIYVTEYDDDNTSHKTLKSVHEVFASKKEIELKEEIPIVQSKPHLDEKTLIRAIQITLNRVTTSLNPITKDGVM